MACWVYIGRLGHKDHCQVGKQRTTVRNVTNRSRTLMTARAHLHFRHSLGLLERVWPMHYNVYASCTGPCKTHLCSSQLMVKASISSDRAEQGNAAHVPYCPWRATAYKIFQLALAHPWTAAHHKQMGRCKNIPKPRNAARTVYTLMWAELNKHSLLHCYLTFV